MTIRMHRLLDEDPDPTQGTDPASDPTQSVGSGDDKKTTPSVPSVIELSDSKAKVKLPDGREVTVGELLASQEEARTLASKMETVKRMFSNADPDGRLLAVRQTLSGLGYSEADIDAYVASAFPDDQDDLDDEDDDEDYDDDDETGDPPMSQYDDSPLRAELDSVKKNQHQHMVNLLQRQLRETLDLQVDKHPRVGVLLKKTEAIARQKHVDSATGRVDEAKVAEAVQKARDSVRAQLEQKTLQRLNERKVRTGEFDPSFFLEESASAAEDVVGVFQTALVDLDMIGRAPETVSGSEDFKFLENTKPAPSPKFDERDPNTYDVQKQVEEYATDTLTRLAAKTVAAEGGSAI